MSFKGLQKKAKQALAGASQLHSMPDSQVYYRLSLFNRVLQSRFVQFP